MVCALVFMVCAPSACGAAAAAASDLVRSAAASSTWPLQRRSASAASAVLKPMRISCAKPPPWPPSPPPPSRVRPRRRRHPLLELAQHNDSLPRPQAHSSLVHDAVARHFVKRLARQRLEPAVRGRRADTLRQPTSVRCLRTETEQHLSSGVVCTVCGSGPLSGHTCHRRKHLVRAWVAGPLKHAVLAIDQKVAATVLCQIAAARLDIVQQLRRGRPRACARAPAPAPAPAPSAAELPAAELPAGPALTAALVPPSCPSSYPAARLQSPSAPPPPRLRPPPARLPFESPRCSRPPPRPLQRWSRHRTNCPMQGRLGPR